MSSSPFEDLLSFAKSWNVAVDSDEFAGLMDDSDPLKSFRSKFFYPKMRCMPKVDLSLVCPEDDAVYLCGNSLGLQPKNTETIVNRELRKWAESAEGGRSSGELPWEQCDKLAVEGNAVLVGAEKDEIVVMNSLSVNLHCLLGVNAHDLYI
ncbi:unnamed protein product [Soboliphyme baturini]|uniref:DAO domain-containing protein n=1 Tax=Soboliphyme baturini TaxID=241478 RepID=A0A183J1M3_9BILA|nr:unnamed protein product [Soboliphyme baturini]